MASNEITNQDAPASLPDLSQLSNEQLIALKRARDERHNAVQAGVPADLIRDLEGLTGSAFKTIGGAIDSVTGAPVRSAIGALQEGKGAAGAVKAYGRQFGADSSTAPTGKEIAARAGVPTKKFSETNPLFPFPNTIVDKSPADVAGLGVDVAADPLTIAAIPGTTAKVLSKAPGVIGELGEGMMYGLKNFRESAMQVPVAVTAKLGEGLTGVPDQLIQNYWNRTQQVDSIAKQYGGDVPAAVSEFKKGILDDVRAAKSRLNDQIGEALKAFPNEKMVPVDPILETLDKSSARFNANLYPQAKKEIDDIGTRILEEAGNDGKLSIQQLQEIKQWLFDSREGASGRVAILKDGLVFQRSSKAQQAAQQAGFEAKTILDELGPPELRAANQKLYELHQIEEYNRSKAFLDPDSSPAQVFAGGSGQNKQSRKYLEDIGKATGKDTVTQAKDLATANVFSNPSLLPLDTTGKSFTRMAVGAGAGKLTKVPGGEYIGAALASPITWKAAIQAGRIPVGLVERLAEGTSGPLDALAVTAYKTAQTPEGRQMVYDYLNQNNQKDSAIDRRAKSVRGGK